MKLKKILKKLKIEKIPKRYLIGANVIVLALIALVFAGPHLPFKKSSFITDGNHPLIKTEAKRIYEDCRYGGEREECYKKEFEPVTKTSGLFFSEHTLYAMQDLDPQLRHCHVLSHAIAQMATRNQPKRWQELLNSVNVDSCGAGFFHGILEAHAGDNPDFEINSDTIEEICVNGTMDFKSRTCAHIFGHLALIEWYGNVDEALPICRGLRQELAQECGTGVFMEDSFQPGLFEHGMVPQLPVRDKARLDRQKARCFNYSHTEGRACWTDLAEIFVEYNNYEPAPAYKECYSAPTKPEGDACYFKAVILMAVSPAYDQPGKMVAPCKFFQDEEAKYNHCVNFMISSLMYYSPKFANRGIELCANIPKKSQAGCFEELGQLLKQRVSAVADREDLCRGTPAEFMDVCVLAN